MIYAAFKNRKKGFAKMVIEDEVVDSKPTGRKIYKAVDGNFVERSSYSRKEIEEYLEKHYKSYTEEIRQEPKLPKDRMESVTRNQFQEKPRYPDREQNNFETTNQRLARVTRNPLDHLDESSPFEPKSIIDVGDSPVVDNKIIERYEKAKTKTSEQEPTMFALRHIKTRTVTKWYTSKRELLTKANPKYFMGDVKMNNICNVDFTWIDEASDIFKGKYLNPDYELVQRNPDGTIEVVK